MASYSEQLQTIINEGMLRAVESGQRLPNKALISYRGLVNLLDEHRHSSEIKLKTEINLMHQPPGRLGDTLGQVFTDYGPLWLFMHHGPDEVILLV